ncbi:hypothetical protein NIES21_05290 [Anabaenopsis circularis NIES-21]|uniref:Uncharacterized protein n=1 Tax=Anabaenopsis circularis NIES-21 TaxID=1085406 RepID=A0A1Z4GB87_9CYAN|nr:hypothetical protein NIES21_05290 [Anabaenopsis circularis NIES-21]
MKKPNFLDSTKQPRQNLRWTIWFPYPTSWLKALTLAIFLRVIIFVVEKAGKISYYIIDFTKSIELSVILCILIILSPILLIAFTHHFLHLFISHFLSKIQAPEVGKMQGLLPGLISCWEGLYGWLVIIISGLIAVLCFTFFMPVFNISYNQAIVDYTEYQRNIITGLFGTFYISTASAIYHIEYLVKCRYISVYAVHPEQSINKNNNVLAADTELNKLRNEMGMYAISSNINPKIELKVNPVKNKNSWNVRQKRLILLLIISTIGALYLIIQSPFVQNKIIFSASSKNQLPTLSTTPQLTPVPVNSKLPTVSPQSDNFRGAVNQAISAANLTQSAKSQTEWQNIVKQWEAAISMMQSVPLSSPNYEIAQQKIIEYQRNLSYAQKNATNSK